MRSTDLEPWAESLIRVRRQIDLDTGEFTWPKDEKGRSIAMKPSPAFREHMERMRGADRVLARVRMPSWFDKKSGRPVRSTRKSSPDTGYLGGLATHLLLSGLLGPPPCYPKGLLKTLANTYDASSRAITLTDPSAGTHVFQAMTGEWLGNSLEHR